MRLGAALLRSGNSQNWFMEVVDFFGKLRLTLKCSPVWLGGASYQVAHGASQIWIVVKNEMILTSLSISPRLGAFVYAE